jgi:hypothetical protein
MANLIEENYFKAHYNYKTEANGPLHTIDMWGYESLNKLYDVINLSNRWYCRTNGGPWISEFSPIHCAILKHFKLEV